MTTRIKLRRDTAANWEDSDPVLALGEPGYDTTNNKIKVGDGTSTWTQLSYLTDESGGGSTGDILFNNNIIHSVDGATIYIDPSNDNGNTGYISIPGPETADTDTLSIGNQMNGGVQIESNSNTWKFNPDGTMYIPEGGDIQRYDGESYVSVLGGGGGSTGDINFDGTDIYAPNNQVISIYAQDDTDIGRASLTLDPGDGYPVARLKTLYPNNSSFSSDAWDGTAQWIVNGGGGRIDFTSDTLSDFLYNTLVHCDNITIEVNGQNAGQYYGANTGPGYVQFNVENPPVEGPITVTEITFNYDEVGQIYLDHNEGTMEINGGTGLSLSLKTRQGVTLQANGKNWNFGTDGNLQLPNGGDIRDSSGNTVLGSGLSITDFGEGFSLTASDKIVTNKLYSTNETQPTQHYRLELDTNGVVHLPDQSIINGSTLKSVAGNYAGITAGPEGADEDSWVWAEPNGVFIATDYSTNAYTWQFDNSGAMIFPDSTVQNTAYQTTTAPTTSKGASGDKAGMVAFDNSNFYYCKADYTDGSADIWNKMAWTDNGEWN